MNNETRWAEIKVGVFVIGAFLILIIGSLWITGSLFFRGHQLDYWVLMKSSGEIEVGDRVRMSGVSVGRIKEVRLRTDKEWPVAFQVALRPDVPIKADSMAQILTSGLLGDGSLQIGPGTSEAPLLKQGGEIFGQTAPDLQELLEKMDQMTGFINEVSKEARPVLVNLKTLISEDNAMYVREILLGLQETVDQSGPRFSSLTARLDSISERLETELEEVPLVMKTFSELGSDFRTAIGPKGSRLTKIVDRAENTLISAQRSLSIININREELGSTMKDLRATASNFKEFSQQIKERPFTLTRIHPEADRRPGQTLTQGSR